MNEPLVHNHVCTVQIFSKSPIETRNFPIGRCSTECWLLYLWYFLQLLERYWSIVRAVKVFHWEWLSDCCYVGLLQLGQCWFATRALLQLLTPLQSPLLAVLLESLGILLFTRGCPLRSRVYENSRIFHEFSVFLRIFLWLLWSFL